MPNALRASLFGLNRARLITAALALAVGGLLRQAGAFPYPFGPFGLAVLAAVAACAILPLAQAFIRDVRDFGRLQLALDVALVSAIVATSGGAQSIFVPLYVLTVLAASFVLPRADAFAVAGLSSAFYVAVVLGPGVLASLGGASGSGTTTDEALATGLNAAVLLVVGFVTSSLAGRNRESQANLDANRKSLSDLLAFRDLIFESVGSGLVGVDPHGPINLPPLRERHEDIPLLVAHFLQKFSKELGKEVRGVASDAMAVLEHYHWPGNIRELENCLERAIVLGAGDMLTVDALPESVRRERPVREAELVELPDEGLDLEATLDELERRYLQRALDRTRGVQTKAAELLKMTFRQFRYKLQKHSMGRKGAVVAEL